MFAAWQFTFNQMEHTHSLYFPIKFCEKVRSYGEAKKERLEIRIWERILGGVGWLILACGHLCQGSVANHGGTSSLGPRVTALALLEVESNDTARSVRTEASLSKKFYSGVWLVTGVSSKSSPGPQGIQERKNNVSELPRHTGQGSRFSHRRKERGGADSVSLPLLQTICYIFSKINCGPSKGWLM